jgi:hypothetical protein
VSSNAERLAGLFRAAIGIDPPVRIRAWDGCASTMRAPQHWIDTLEQRIAEVVALLGEEVARVWRLYPVGGMLAFEEGRMGVDQILATKPR